MVDPASGAGTQHALRRDIELARAALRGGPPPALVRLHLDGLDQIRLTMGSPAAEQVVRAFVEVAPFALRARDRIYRSGLSEMIVMLPGADRYGVAAARNALESTLTRFLSDKGLPSVGIAVRSVGVVAAAG